MGAWREWPLRPELEAPLGVCPLSQLTQGVGGGSCLLLSGGVAVLCCCIGSTPVSLLGPARCAVRTRRPSANAGHMSMTARKPHGRWMPTSGHDCQRSPLLLSPLLSVLHDASSMAAHNGWHLGALVLVTATKPSSAHRAAPGLHPQQGEVVSSWVSWVNQRSQSRVRVP